MMDGWMDGLADIECSTVMWCWGLGLCLCLRLDWLFLAVVVVMMMIFHQHWISTPPLYFSLLTSPTSISHTARHPSHPILSAPHPDPANTVIASYAATQSGISFVQSSHRRHRFVFFGLVCSIGNDAAARGCMHPCKVLTSSRQCILASRIIYPPHAVDTPQYVISHPIKQHIEYMCRRYMYIWWVMKFWLTSTAGSAVPQCPLWEGASFSMLNSSICQASWAYCTGVGIGQELACFSAVFLMPVTAPAMSRNGWKTVLRFECVYNLAFYDQTESSNEYPITNIKLFPRCSVSLWFLSAASRRGRLVAIEEAYASRWWIKRWSTDLANSAGWWEVKMVIIINFIANCDCGCDCRSQKGRLALTNNQISAKNTWIVVQMIYV